MAFPTNYSQPGWLNVFIPTFDDNAKLIVDYSRNEKDFALNQYCTMVTVDKPIGFYMKKTPKDQSRLVSATGNDRIWSQGARRSQLSGQEFNSRNGWIQYQLKPYFSKGSADYMTMQNAVYDVKASILADLATEMMELRTALAQTVVFDTAQYASNHVSTATAAGGGFWSAGTLANPIIKKSLAKARIQIILDTNGKVKAKDLVLVVNPTVAAAMANSEEIHTYMAQQSESEKVLTGDDPDANTAFGLPPRLYGFKLVVEATPYTNALPDTNPDAQSTTFIMDSNKALVVARPGGVTGGSGGAAFSTLHCLQDKNNEMVSESFDNPEDHLMDFYVNDVNTFIVPAPETGYIFTNVLS